MKTNVLQERIYRYLLSDLPEEEQSILEQEFLADVNLFERVWEAENELIDGYVRGRLTAAEKDLFERNYLASPVHRQRLAFATNLIRAADSVPSSVNPNIGTARSSRSNSLLTSRYSNRLAWAMAATVLLFVASSVWLFAENRRLREQLNLARNDVASEQRIKELEKDLEAQRDQRDQLAAELAAAREETSPTVGRETQPNQKEPLVLSFLLSPVLMRSGGAPQELKISKDITAVLLKMRVQEPDGRLFQVRLRRVDGAQIWSKDSIRPRTQEKNDLVVSVSIPADRIANGDYILTLSATNSANVPEEINRYFFRVIKQ